jgi:hypothetical protein
MAIKEYTFTGIIEYPHLSGPNKYGKFSLDFFPSNDADRKAIKATGTKCSLKERENEKSAMNGKFFYTFTSPEVPEVSGVPDNVLVGNGTKAVVTVTVEDFMSPKWGKVVRTKLASVKVLDLIPYEPKDATDLPV